MKKKRITSIVVSFLLLIGVYSAVAQQGQRSHKIDQPEIVKDATDFNGVSDAKYQPYEEANHSYQGSHIEYENEDRWADQAVYSDENNPKFNRDDISINADIEVDLTSSQPTPAHRWKHWEEMEREKRKHYQEEQREARKHFEEMEREERKHREEMEREELKRYQEMAREEGKYWKEMERGNWKRYQ